MKKLNHQTETHLKDDFAININFDDRYYNDNEDAAAAEGSYLMSN